MDIAKKWKIENNISAVDIDNAPYIKGAVRLNNWRHIMCFAHVLKLEFSMDLKIVMYFKQSSTALHKLHTIQKQIGFENLKLIQECKT